MCIGLTLWCVCRYEERLQSMMLREEFFPLMEEVKHSVTILTNAANGNLTQWS